MTLDRRTVLAALPVGPLLAVVGYAVLMQSHTRISDPMLVGVLVFPTAVLLLAGVLAAVLRRDATRWISVAIGAATGTAVAAGVVGAGIWLVASMLSDPGGQRKP